MVRMQMLVVVAVVTVCCSSVEARGRRMMYQPVYTQNYNATVPMNTVTQPSVTVQPATPQTNVVVQTNNTNDAGVVVQANSVAAPVYANGSAVTTSNASAVGSAQWKAEQSARMGSVQHIGGGFGGGSFEGNGFGATPDQAIQSACFWGQRTPIQIGVARGANGYYATVFYR